MGRKENMPLWVFLGLMSIETRKGAMALLWSCILFGIACVPMMFYFSEWVDWTWVAMMAVFSVWYWLCIRWVDANAGW